MIVQHDEHARMFVEKILGCHIHEPYCGLLFYDPNLTNGIYAAVVVNCYDRWECRLTIVSNGPWSVHDARELARYVFATNDCHRVTVETPVGNKRARRILEALGFRIEGLKRQGSRHGDLLMYGLLRAEQKLIKCDIH